ncbi:hypothetical protein [Planctomicrobium sp. SH527]|uniref:hypothetical protein n=1 Tax=Planctomicrobium sp. SH527 TaxID=3448123 RepID=UPI003F5AF252
MNKLTTLTAAGLMLILLGVFATGVLAWQEVKGDTKATNGAETPQADAEATISDTEAVELLRQARNRLFERRSIQAQMSQVISIGPQRVKSTGSYLAAAGFRYRFQYQLSLGDLQGEFLEVCDGQLLHTRRQIAAVNEKVAAVAPPEIELTRRDIQRIRREALGIKDAHPAANLSEALLEAEVGIGGIPAILAMLERTLILSPIRTQTVDGRDYLVLQGRLRPDRKNELIVGLGSAASQVENFLPDVVRVYLEKETLFPEKFLYLKRTSNDQNSLRPLITVEFSNIILDQPVPDGQFIYMAPPGVEEKDETTQYLEAMRQAATQATRPPETEPAPAQPGK